MTEARQARTRVRDAIATHPWVCRTLAGAARYGGARSAAAKLRQLSLDLVTVSVPEVATGGVRVTVRLPGRAGRDQIATALRESGWTGFEPPMPTVFAACAATFPGVVYDIGANTGFYSVVAARVARANKVVAFEPFPPVLANLKSTLRVNRCSDRVHVEPAALSSAPGEATLYVPLQDHGLVETSATLSASFKEEYSDAIDVRVLTLDAYDESASPGRATLLKIDVESMEASVLRGALRILKTHRPIVFCEVLPSGDAKAIDAIRQQVRYTDIRLHADAAFIGSDVSFDPAGWNHLLVPDEKLERVEPLLTRCGLTLERAE
ncbi:MAG TPA: FkbM family methyltransferase [Acidimicrobiales bacterium]|nr:FkbM family methyltransferase [Acidimicrobiales bacterium]